MLGLLVVRFFYLMVIQINLVNVVFQTLKILFTSFLVLIRLKILILMIIIQIILMMMEFMRQIAWLELFMLVRKVAIMKQVFQMKIILGYGDGYCWWLQNKSAGWKIIYYGKSEIIHYKGASSKKQKSKLIYEFYRAMYLFYNKHYDKKYSFFTRLSVYLGIIFLLTIKLLLNAFKK